jgi:D-2-hydroxyacid dehydrogenase (NADP+)
MMNNKILIHISAFNPNDYKIEIAKLFPALSISCSYDNEVHANLYNCDVLIGFGPGLNDEIFNRNQNLKFVQSLGTGVNGIADRPGLNTQVPVSSMRGIHGPQMSEQAFMIMLSLNRNFPELLENQKNRVWSRKPPQILFKKTVGLLGVGLIAEALALRCKAFDMKVIGISNTNRIVESIDEIRNPENLPEAVRDLDYLIILVPLTSKTRNIVNGKVLASMKSSAYLVNIARGGVLDDQAIINALKIGEIAGAGLDVFEEEPLSPSSPFGIPQTWL